MAVDLLLIRRPRQLELTPAGQALLDYCADVGAADQRLQQRVTAADAEHGKISLISPGSIGLALYPYLLDLQQATPGLTIRHRFAPDGEVLAGVLENRFESGLVSLKPDDPRLRVSWFATEPLDLVVPAGVAVQDWSDLQRLAPHKMPYRSSRECRRLSILCGCCTARNGHCRLAANGLCSS